MSSIDEALIEWKTWLDALETQIYVLHHRRQIHDEFMEMLDAAGEDDRTFQDAFHGMYIESQVMAIRRQADNDPRTLSLRRLIGQLEQRRRDFTREWYVKRWMAGRDPASADQRDRDEARFHQRNANDAFDRFTDSPGDDVLGGRRLQEDRDDLLRLTERVVRYADTTVAHADRTADGVEATYAEFHEALEHLGLMLQRYYLLIDQGGLVSATPVMQSDWKSPFRQPLAEPRRTRDRP
jgi:hypothetical protein